MILRARNLISLCALAASFSALVAGCERAASAPRVGAVPAGTATATRPTVEPAIALVRSEDGAAHRDAAVRPAAHLSSISEASSHSSSPTVPDWAADAVFYQIFPERFATAIHRTIRPKIRSNRQSESPIPGRFRPGPATGMPAPIGKRSWGQTSSKTAFSTGATAATCKA